MPTTKAKILKDGDKCRVVGRTHSGKSGIVRVLIQAKQDTLQSPLYKKTESGSKPLERMLKFYPAAINKMR